MKLFTLLGVTVFFVLIVFFTLKVTDDKNVRFDYTETEDGKIVLTGCPDKVSEMTVPSEIDGKKVVGIGNGFYGNSATLKNLVISDGIEYIGEYAFYGCAKLKKAVLPESLTDIGKGAFSDCTRLKSIGIPENLSGIGSSAFEGCLRLGKIKIPRSCESIGEDAFLGCENLIMDVGENPAAAVIAAEYGIPTDFSESSDSTLITVAVLLAICLALLTCAYKFLPRILSSVKKRRKSGKESEE